MPHLCKLWTAQIFLFHRLFQNHTCYIPILRVSKNLFDTPHILLNYHGILTLLHPYILCINIQSVCSEKYRKTNLVKYLSNSWNIFVRQQEQIHERLFNKSPMIAVATLKNLYRSVISVQSHYREVPRWEIFMEQELRFGLDLGRLAVLKKKFWADYEQLFRAKKC